MSYTTITNEQIDAIDDNSPELACRVGEAIGAIDPPSGCYWFDYDTANNYLLERLRKYIFSPSPYERVYCAQYNTNMTDANAAVTAVGATVNGNDSAATKCKKVLKKALTLLTS